MAEEQQQAAEWGMNNNIIVFVYTGEQEAPWDVTHVVIDKSVEIIPRMMTASASSNLP
jgi:hypothetical protein